MLEIIKSNNDDVYTLKLSGRLDTTTSPQLDTEVKSLQDKVSRLVMDLENLEYISSAGLRILLSAHKMMATRGGMKIVNVNSFNRELLDTTGFSEILDIE